MILTSLLSLLRLVPLAVAVPFIPVFRIKITRVSDGSLLGYVAQANGPFTLPTYTTDVNAALYVAYDGPKVTKFGTCADILEVNAPDANHQYFGTYEATTDYKIISAVSQTPPGSTKQPTGSTRSPAAKGESCLWSINLVTAQLNQIWVQDDGVPENVTQAYFGSGTSGYFLAAVNEIRVRAQFPTAVFVNYILELVTNGQPTPPTDLDEGDQLTLGGQGLSA